MNKKINEKAPSDILDKSDFLVIKNINVIDINNKIIHENFTIICCDGEIYQIAPTTAISIPEKSKIIELSGKYVIPGLIDAHVHLAHPGVDDYGRISTETITTKFLRHSYQTIKSGVTTIRNMPGSSGYSILKFRDKVNKGQYIGPRIFASGPALSAPYGYFSIKRFIPAPPFLLGILSRIFGAHGLSIDVSNPKEAYKIVRKLKKTGVDFIKTTTPGGILSLIENEPGIKDYYIKKGVNPLIVDANMNLEILKAIVKTAHDEKLKVSVHSICLPDGIKQAVEAGVDSVEHTPLGLIDDETFSLMKEKGIYWVPTGYCYFHWANLIDKPDLYSEEEIKTSIPEPYYSIGKRALEKQREEIKSNNDPNWGRFYSEMPNYKQLYFPENLKKAIKAGVKIVAGVDAGMGGAGYVPHGFLYKEIELFVKYGMDEFDAIKTATINSAELLGVFESIGTLETKKKADMVILSSNPIDNILNLRKVEYVIKDGKIVYDSTRSSNVIA